MIIVDCIIAIMLMISIIYSWQLNKKIKEFRESKGMFAEMIKTLDNAIVRAELGIEDLKKLGNSTANDLNNKIHQAKFLSDDLAFMTDRASILADKLEKTITIARNYEKTLQHEQQIEHRPLLVEQSFSRQNMVNNNGLHKPFYNNIMVSAKQSDLNAEKPVKKVAIESLLARISAVKNGYKKEKIES